MVEGGRGSLRLDTTGANCTYWLDLKNKQSIPNTSLLNYPWGKDFLK